MDAISASKLPRAEVCPASFALPAQHEPGGRYADDGTAIHAQLHAAAHGKDAPAWLRGMYAELTEGATAIYAERCYAWSPETGAGRDLGTHDRDYSSLRDGEIGGTADLVVVKNGEVQVIDYKSGFFGVAADSPQLSMLALAVRDALQVGEVTVTIVKIDAEQKDWYPKHKTLDALDLADETMRLRRIVKRVDEARKLVQLGRTPDVRLSDDGCRYCPCKAACPAKTGAIATVASLAGLAKPEASIPVTAENAGAVWMAIDAMGAVLAKAREQVKELARSGPVPLPDGRELWAVEETRESVADVDKAAAVLAEKYGEDAVAEAVEVKRTVSKGALEAVAKKRAAPEQGARDAKALIDALRDVGAMKSSSYLKYAAKEKKASLPMSDGLNRVMLLGNLGADPELRSTNGGESVLRLRLATSERYLDRNKAWQERTEWHSVIVWGKRAEALHRILSKGSTLFVEGSLRTSSYDDKDGVKRYKTEVNAKEIILTGGRSSAGDSGGGSRSGGSRSDGRPRGDFAGESGGTDWSNAEDGFGKDDDVPF